MKHKAVFLFAMVLLGSSCSKEEATTPEYLEGKVLHVSCGGTVIQILSDRELGESWTDFLRENPEELENVVLASNVPLERQVEGTGLLFTYKPVEYFSGNNYCEIGGLPGKKIELLRLKP